MKRLSILIFVLLSITSCNEYNDLISEAKQNKLKNNVVDNTTDDPEPPFPDHEGDSILGVDSDGDNVRDDVEIWINFNVSNKTQRLVLKKLSASIQEILKRPKIGGNEKDKLFRNFHDLNSCTLYVDWMINKKSNTKDMVISLMFNSKKREDAFWEYSGDRNFRHSEGKLTHEDFCGLDLKDLNK